MIDIMVMLAVTKNPFVFVGKKELAKIPVFGFFYKRTCILVDRGNAKSRKAVFDEARRRLQNGLSICIFPEGLVPEDESIVLSDFKNGAFRLAIEHQIPIVPLTFFDCKKRFSYTLFSGSPGKLRVKIDNFIETKGLTLKELNSLKEKTYHLIHQNLITDLNEKKIRN
jgi:1-acyl-sn-glycerol-3-phosphate acyltransferase